MCQPTAIFKALIKSTYVQLQCDLVINKDKIAKIYDLSLCRVTIANPYTTPFFFFKRRIHFHMKGREGTRFFKFYDNSKTFKTVARCPFFPVASH